MAGQPGGSLTKTNKSTLGPLKELFKTSTNFGNWWPIQQNYDEFISYTVSVSNTP